MTKKFFKRNLGIAALGLALAVGTTGCGLNLGSDYDDSDIDFSIDDFESDDVDVNFDDETDFGEDDYNYDTDEYAEGEDQGESYGDEEGGEDGTTPGSFVTSSLTPEVEQLLASIQSDYNKINWGVRYSVSDDYTGFVISVAPYMENGEYSLILGFTNLYDTPISFSGTANVLGTSDEIVTSSSIYTQPVGSGNTVFEVIPCGSTVLDGRIRWEDCQFNSAESDAFVPWEADYATEGNPADGYMTVNYSIYSSTGSDMVPNTVTFMVLDASGNVLAIGTDYVTDTVAAGSKYEGTVSIFSSSDTLAGAKGIAMFAESGK